MTIWLTHFIENFGYLAIILLIAVENIFPPIPSEVILTLGGFLVSGTKLTLIGVILASTLGSVIGAIILFSISRNLTLPRLEKLLETKLFKLLGFKKDDAQKAIDWFDKHGIGANDQSRVDGLSRDDKTTVTAAFLEGIKAAGYVPMIYGDKEWLIKEIDMTKLQGYDVWLSQEEDIPDYPYQYTMWQYATDGVLNGINGNAALKSVLTSRVQENKLIVLDELKLDEIKTKNFKNVMDNLKVEKAIVVLGEKDDNVIISARNLPTISTAVADNINVYDILKGDTVVLTKDAVAKIEEVYA